jgi:hypothetical protein
VDRVYESYGLTLVADGEVPGLPPSRAVGAREVRIWLNKMPQESSRWQRTCRYRSPRTDQDGTPNLVIWHTGPDGAFHFSYADRTEFLISADGSEIWSAWAESATVADAAVYLRGPVLGFVLRLHGVVTLHASAVAVDQRAIAILGRSGGGKSTTAAGFVKLGFPLLTDDVTALSPGVTALSVLPGYPRLNLWADVAEALYGASARLPRLTPVGGINDWWDKRYLGLDAERQFHGSPLPLAAVYVLAERAAESTAPRVEELSRKDAFIALTDQAYVNYTLDESMRATEFRTLGQLVRTTPVRLVTPHANPDRLLDLCNTILDDCRQPCSRQPAVFT